VVFLGDSITQFYQTGAGASVWNAKLAPLGAVDYGIEGSETSSVLWQIATGQLSGIHPQVIVLMIGVNNLAQGETPAQTVDGVVATLEAIQAVQPQAHILLMGLLPVGTNVVNNLGLEALETNYALATEIPNGRNIFYLGVDQLFMSGQGYQNPALTIDFTHPSEQGYSVLASAEIPMIQNLEAPTVTGLDPITLALPTYNGVGFFPIE
jgi:lysophospholipase L1-like esterase